MLRLNKQLTFWLTLLLFFAIPSSLSGGNFQVVPEAKVTQEKEPKPILKIDSFEIASFELKLIRGHDEYEVCVKCSKDGGQTWETKSILEITGHLSPMNLALLYSALSGAPIDYTSFAWHYCNVTPGEEPSAESINIINSKRDAAKKVSVWIPITSKQKYNKSIELPDLLDVGIYEYNHERKGFPLGLNRLKRFLPATSTLADLDHLPKDKWRDYAKEVQVEAINYEKCDFLPADKELQWSGKLFGPTSFGEVATGKAIILLKPLSIERVQTDLEGGTRAAIIAKILAMAIFPANGGPAIAVLTDVEKEPVAKIEPAEKEKLVEESEKKVGEEVLFGTPDSRFFHRRNCPELREIRSTALIKYTSVDFATGIGKVPCKVCMPQGEQYTPASGGNLQKELLERRDAILLYYVFSGEKPTEKVLVEALYPELFSFRNEFERQEQYKTKIKIAEETFSREIVNNVYDCYYVDIGDVGVGEYDFGKGGFPLLGFSPSHSIGVTQSVGFFKTSEYYVSLFPKIEFDKFLQFLPVDQEKAKNFVKVFGEPKPYQEGRGLHVKALWNPIGLEVVEAETYHGERGRGEYHIIGKVTKLEFYAKPGEYPDLTIDVDIVPGKIETYPSAPELTPPPPQQTTTPQVTPPDRRLIDGRWYKRSYIEDPPSSGTYKEVWLPEEVQPEQKKSEQKGKEPPKDVFQEIGETLKEIFEGKKSPPWFEK